MIKYDHYVRPQSLEEAWSLAQKRRNTVLGGMLWLNLGRGKYSTVIDLCDLSLRFIEEREDDFRIGAYTTLTELETSETLNAHFHGAFRDAFCAIEGVQLRNMATLGGSVVLRAGFSDVCTLLLAMDAKIELYRGGIVSMEEYLASDRRVRDILVSVMIPKTSVLTAYTSHRNANTDLPALNCAVTKQGSELRVAVGARPGKAVLRCVKAEKPDTEALAEGIAFESNLRGSAEYRKMIASVLIERALEKIAKEEN